MVAAIVLGAPYAGPAVDWLLFVAVTGIGILLIRQVIQVIEKQERIKRLLQTRIY